MKSDSRASGGAAVPARTPDPEAARLRWILALCLVTTLSLGVVKLFQQRGHPPAWAPAPHNTYAGFVSIDRFAVRAERIQAFALGLDPGAHELTRHLKESLHPTSLSVPALVALIALPLGSIVLAFVTTSAALFVLEVLLVMRLARRLEPVATNSGGGH